MTLFNSQLLVVDKKLAVVIGLNEALVLQQIHYWIEINKKSNRNFHEGRYWTYNTINEWQKGFPFWSTSTIKRILKKLRDMKIVEVDNFNVYQMDRTLWYTINYEELDKLCPVELDNADEASKEENIEGKAQSDQAISSNRHNPKDQNKPMEKVKETSPIPENTTETSTEISIQSINQSKEKDRQMKKETSYRKFKEKYERIVHNCELYAIDEKYRLAVTHAIKLLILDTEKNSYIKIGKTYIPSKIVEDDLERINFFVVEHAVNKFKEISSIQRIANPLGYLKVLIYNSINEVEIDIDSKLRYESLIS